jgi:hypothetical protein
LNDSGPVGAVAGAAWAAIIPKHAKLIRVSVVCRRGRRRREEDDTAE